MRLEEIYRKLDLIGKGGFVSLSNPEWDHSVQLSDRVLRLIKDTDSPLSKVSAFFCIDGKPLIFFFENPSDTPALHRTIWNLNEIPIVVVCSDETVGVYNGFAYKKELGSLQCLGDESILDDFSYFKIVTGKGWEDYKKELAHKNRVDYFLLDNIQYAQEKILKTSVSRNLANRLIGKMIFLRYLTDRNVMLSFEGETRTLSNDDLIELLQNKGRLANLFDTLQNSEKGFNGDLFRITREELAAVPDKALDVLVRLLRCDDLQSDSYSLFDVYDFSILPVEFISNVYERFIGRDNQEKEGAYYTPYFLVDYMVENTVAKHLAGMTKSSCKVLDPACGSGIFLVETLRRIIDHYKAHATSDKLQGRTFQDMLRKLATDNIFGIDSDESAVQVAAFSLYLTLLDYQQPADISNFRFPNLLGTNLICQDAFEEAPFRGIKFDYILGNPPWNRGRVEFDENGNEKEAAYEKYIKERAREEGKDRIIGNNEIAQAFVVRSMDFMSAETKSALVLTSKVLYNSQSAPFRTYLLEKVLVDSVLELSSVRKEVFSQSSDPSVAPACILFYQKKAFNNVEIQNHLVTHAAVKPSVFFSLFKVLTIEKADIQRVRQELLVQYDYLWKILLYGSYLDFLFVKRLKGMKSIRQEMKDRGFIEGQGVTIGKERNRTYDISHRIGQKRIDADDLLPYFISPSDAVWQVSHAQWGRKDILFKAPMLLVRKSTGTDYTCRAAVSQEDAGYTDAITGVHGDSLEVLRNIAGLLNSRLFPYYALMNLSSIGTEREQAHNVEKFSLPYIGGNIASHVERIETLYRKYATATFPTNFDALRQIEDEKSAIDQSINQALNVTEVEQALIDYAIAYTIPLATGKLESKSVTQNAAGYEILEKYAEVFLTRFNGQFGEGRYLNYECSIANSHVMVRFFVTNRNEEPTFKAASLDALEQFLLKLSVEGLSDNLYLRKDIRGFEENGFYIVKPCDQRLWHPAMAYVDVEEFVDAILLNQNDK